MLLEMKWESKKDWIKGISFFLKTEWIWIRVSTIESMNFQNVEYAPRKKILITIYFIGKKYPMYCNISSPLSGFKKVERKDFKNLHFEIRYLKWSENQKTVSTEWICVSIIESMDFQNDVKKILATVLILYIDFRI